MKRKSQFVLIFFILTVAILYIFRDSSLLRGITGGVQNLFSGIRGDVYSTTLDTESRLQEENRRLEERLASYQDLERENQALRSQFEEGATGEMTLVPASVIGFKGRGENDTFVVNVGSRQGVQKGMAVIVGKTLIGTVDQVSEEMAEVMTVLNPRFSTLGKYAPTNARGIVRGFDDFIIFENVAITDTLERDGIVTSFGELDAQGIGIPADLVVGRIDSIEREETEAFQSAQVEFGVGFSTLSTVFIVLRN